MSKPERRISTFERWSSTRFDKGERLLAFEKWLGEQLGRCLKWPKNPHEREKMLFACRGLVVQAVADLGRHGYLFEPRELASEITGKLDEIRRLQELGHVDHLYPYFKAIWKGYVTSRAEKLHDSAMRAGSHISQHLKPSESIPYLVAEERRESALESKRRARRKQAQEGDDQLALFT